MRIKRNLFAGLFLILGLNIASAQVKLSFNPEKGKKYEYQTEVIQNIKQNLMGQEIPMEMTTSMTCLMEIKDKTPQEIQVQLTYQDLAYVVSGPMMKMEYDSKNPVENPSNIDQMLGKMFGEMLGKSFLAVIAPDGSVQSLTGMEAIGESMTKAIAGDGQMIAQLGAQMKQQFNDDAKKNLFEQSFYFFPANPVRAGNSWNIENAVNMNNFNVVSKSRYTMRSISRNIANIAIDTKIESAVDSEGEVSGTQTGNMTVDARTGIPVTSNLSANIKSNIKSSSMDLLMIIESKSKTSTKKIE